MDAGWVTISNCGCPVALSSPPPNQDEAAPTFIGAMHGTALTTPGFELPLIEPEVAADGVRLPGEFHVDAADRLVAATALQRSAAVVTADHGILAYAAAGHIRALNETH